jgi:hypothetical protein
LLHAGLAAAFGALCGGAYWVAGGAEPQPVSSPAPPQVRPVQETRVAAIPPAAAQATPTEEDSAVSPLTRITVQGPVPFAGAAAQAKQSDAASSRIAASLDSGAAMDADVTGPAAPSASPLTDTRASAATLKDFRQTLEQGREAVRDVVQLGSRRKPGRDASPEELYQFRIRQQNAEAARSYRSYLDTLARLMRGKPSESTARQSLERARQTLGYLNAMLADSQAALR